MIIKILVIILCGLTLFAAGKLAEGISRKFSGNAIPEVSGLFETILKGSILLFIYLQLLSFFIPLKLWVLLPFWICYASRPMQSYLWKELQGCTKATTGPRRYAFLCILFLFVIYCFYPTFNIDSIWYHIPATEFFHDYKLIPGLANINEQVAVNSAVFILNAPFCRIAGSSQGIYPINAVWIISFSWWLLQLSIFRKNTWGTLALAAIFFFSFRVWLININSPSNDVLLGIVTLYVLLYCYDYSVNNKQISISSFCLLCIVSAWGLTIKLNAAPLFLIAGYLAVRLKVWQHKKKVAGAVAVVLLIALLWCSRNVVLSGYLIFLFIKMPFSTMDYTLPDAQVALEKYYLTNGPRVFEFYIRPFQQVNFRDWFPHWFISQFNTNFNWGFISLLMALASLPLALVFMRRKKINDVAFVCWSVSIATTTLWLFTTPEYRFSYTWLMGCWAFLLTTPLLASSAPKIKIIKYTPSLFICLLLVCSYFIVYIIRYYKQDTQMAWLLESPKSFYHIKQPCNQSTQTFTIAGVSISPVLNDSVCLQQSPWLWRYPMTGLEARGRKLEDGFRYRKDAVLFPGIFNVKLVNTDTMPAFRYQ